MPRLCRHLLSVSIPRMRQSGHWFIFREVLTAHSLHVRITDQFTNANITGFDIVQEVGPVWIIPTNQVPRFVLSLLDNDQGIAGTHRAFSGKRADYVDVVEGASWGWH